MLDGMKYATQGMIQMSQKQDVVVNNLSNATTIGFRKEGMTITSFAQVLDKSMGFVPGHKDGKADWSGYMEVGGGLETEAQLFNNTLTSFNQGPLEETGNKFDLALDDSGMGFFTVNTPNGPMYTRGGNFHLQDGKLVTTEGAQLMGMKGPIHIGNGVNLEVTGDGMVKVDGKEVDRLRITTFMDKRTLAKESNSGFVSTSDKGMTLTRGFTVHQGYLEQGNVNAVQEMVDMLQIMRAYEANQKMLQTQDQVLKRAANDLGKVH